MPEDIDKVIEDLEKIDKEKKGIFELDKGLDEDIYTKKYVKKDKDGKK